LAAAAFPYSIFVRFGSHFGSVQPTIRRLEQLTLLLDAALARERLAASELATAKQTTQRIRKAVRDNKDILKRKRLTLKKVKHR